MMAYLVPEGNIQLFSPQVYFQENGNGSGRITKDGVELVLADGTPMYFPLHKSNNLPFLLIRHKPLVGVSRSDAEFLQRFEQVSACLSVAYETNQDLTEPQKELLLWHHRLAHANFQWVHWLVATPRNQGDNRTGPLLEVKVSKVSSCPQPLCAACQVAKQARRVAEVFRNVLEENKEVVLKRDHLKPGDMVSIDQYISVSPDDFHTPQEKNRGRRSTAAERCLLITQAVRCS
jgi:hypothetical protein